MLTTDDLKKIRGILREEVGSSEVKLRGEITGLETKMENRFDKLEKQMGEDRKDWSHFFNDADIFFDDMRHQLVKRI